MRAAAQLLWHVPGLAQEPRELGRDGARDGSAVAACKADAVEHEPVDVDPYARAHTVTASRRARLRSAATSGAGCSSLRNSVRAASRISAIPTGTSARAAT